MECYVTCYTAFTNNDKEPVGLAQWPRALALEESLGSLPSTDMVATVLGIWYLLASDTHGVHTYTSKQNTHTYKICV